MNANRRWLLALCLASATAFAPLSSQASPPTTSEEAFERGRVAFEHGDYATARREFELSYSTDPATGTLLNLAICEQRLGRLASALARLQEALRKMPEADKRFPALRKHIGDLVPRVPRLIVRTATPLPPAVSVFSDDGRLSSGDLERPLPVDPGPHSLRCTGPRG